MPNPLPLVLLLAAALPLAAQPVPEVPAPAAESGGDPDWKRLPGLAAIKDLSAIPGFPAVKSVAELPEGTLLLLIADRSRGNLEGVAWTVGVSAGRTSLEMAVKARGYDFLSRTVAPAKHRGDSVLMISGNMWFHKTGLSKPVPISQRQKLLGGASYGDIAATNYAADYEVKSMEPDEVDGEACRVFSLEAKNDRKTTYDKVRYWVSRSRGVGIKSEFFTVSGKKIKTARMAYDNRVTAAGVEIPFISAIVIDEELTGRAQTFLKLREPRLETVPPSTLDLNLFQR